MAEHFGKKSTVRTRVAKREERREKRKNRNKSKRKHKKNGKRKERKRKEHTEWTGSVIGSLGTKKDIYSIRKTEAREQKS